MATDQTRLYRSFRHGTANKDIFVTLTFAQTMHGAISMEGGGRGMKLSGDASMRMTHLYVQLAQNDDRN